MLDAFVLTFKSLDRVDGIHIEECSTAGAPVAVLVVEHCRGIALQTDGRDVFHVTTFDGLEANAHGDERCEQAGFQVATKGHSILPIAIKPTNAARLAERAGNFEEAMFERLALELEERDGSLNFSSSDVSQQWS